VCGVGPLTSSFFEIVLLAQLFYQQFKEAMFRLMLNQARAKFGEDAEIEAWVGQFQPQ